MWCARSRRSSCRVRTTDLLIRAIRRLCCLGSSTASTAATKPTRVRPATTTANTGSSSIERRERSMKAISRAPIGRRKKAALQLLAAGGLALSLGGCFQTEAEQKAYPVDYRQRHPIVVREGTQTVDVMIGRNRGGLTPDQRADVMAFAQAWRHEAGSGIIIEVPHGGPTDQAAGEANKEIRSILSGVGVP